MQLVVTKFDEWLYSSCLVFVGFQFFRRIRNQLKIHTNDEVGSLLVSFQFRPRILVILKINTRNTHKDSQCDFSFYNWQLFFARRYFIHPFSIVFRSFEHIHRYGQIIVRDKYHSTANKKKKKRGRKENNGQGFCQ